MIRAVEEAGGRILGVQPVRQSLEDYFFKEMGGRAHRVLLGRRRLNRIVAVAANTFRETVRERVLYNLVFFALAMTLSGLLLGHLSIRQDEKIIKDLGLAAIDFFGTLIAIFIGVGLVSKEIERRSLYPLLAKPLSRGEFFLGKFAGPGLHPAREHAAMALGLLVTLWLVGHAPTWRLLAGDLPPLPRPAPGGRDRPPVLHPHLVGPGRRGHGGHGRWPGATRTWCATCARWRRAPRTGSSTSSTTRSRTSGTSTSRTGWPTATPSRLGTLGFVTAYAVVYIAFALVLGLLAFQKRDFQ